MIEPLYVLLCPFDRLGDRAGWPGSPGNMTLTMLHLSHHPGTGNDGVGLEELQTRGSLHLGRDHTQQIVLHADNVHGCDLAAVNDELQRAGKLLRHLSFPMEIHTDRHAIEDEGRLGEHSSLGLSLKHQLVVQRAVVGNPSLGIFHLLPAGAVRDDLELDLAAGHDSDLKPPLRSRQPPDDLFLRLLARGDLPDNLRKQPGVQFVEILFPRGHIDSRQIGAPRTHGQMIRA